MTRFEILKLLSDAFFGATCSQLAKRSGQEHWNTRSFRAPGDKTSAPSILQFDSL
jgi:hypothetical protein